MAPANSHTSAITPYVQASADLLGLPLDAVAIGRVAAQLERSLVLAQPRWRWS